jgi:hypothetical protein
MSAPRFSICPTASLLEGFFICPTASLLEGFFICPTASLLEGGARWQFSGIRLAEDA